MKFKDARVYVEVDNDGKIISKNNRAKMKYSSDDTRIYNPSLKNISKISKSNKHSLTKNKNTIEIYTDGACLKNPGPAGTGYFIQFPDGKSIARGEPLGKATNNIAELTAIYQSLKHIDCKNTPVIINTDSTYSIGVLIQNWKPKANKELIAEIKIFIKKFGNLQFKKVPAHSGVEKNELVDTLAKEAAETQKTVERF